MHPFLRHKVQNQAHFTDLSMREVFELRNNSRYLFLEFIPAHSLILVGNQGSYDLHFFKITRTVEGPPAPKRTKLGLEKRVCILPQEE